MGVDLSNDLLAELAQLDHVEYIKQANNANLAQVDGLGLYAGNDDSLPRTLELGGCGGILVASHLVGEQMRRMVDEPEHRARSTPRCGTCTRRWGSPPTPSR